MRQKQIELEAWLLFIFNKLWINNFEICRRTSKPTKWPVRPSENSDQSDQSSLCAKWVTKDIRFLHADDEDWSDWTDTETDLSSLDTYVILLVLSCYGSNHNAWLGAGASLFSWRSPESHSIVSVRIFWEIYKNGKVIYVKPSIRLRWY